MGTAAYKTVELDDSLGGAPIQHREVQEHESDQFLSVFKGGVHYQEGGVASGFKKVEKDKHEPRLLHLKGARNVRVTSVPVKNTSLNEGDVFILDLGTVIYQVDCIFCLDVLKFVVEWSSSVPSREVERS
jgi:hypothetical protein